jgi:hypothetical protein
LFSDLLARPSVRGTHVQEATHVHDRGCSHARSRHRVECAISTVINAVLLRPLPFPKSEQRMALYMRFLPSSGHDVPFFGLSGPEFADVRSRVHALAGRLRATLLR